MFERRQHVRYILMPPQAGRALIDDIGQVEAQLLDVSIEGARMALAVDTDAQARLLAGNERSMAATFARPNGAPWKFVLIHSRLTTIAAAAAGGSRCVVAGRMVVAPSFGSADLESLIVANAACCAVANAAALQIRGAATLAIVQTFVAQAARAGAETIRAVDLSAVRLLERDATLSWLVEAAGVHPALAFVLPQG